MTDLSPLSAEELLNLRDWENVSRWVGSDEDGEFAVDQTTFEKIATAYDNLYRDCCVMREALISIESIESMFPNQRDRNRVMNMAYCARKALTDVSEYPKPE